MSSPQPLLSYAAVAAADLNNILGLLNQLPTDDSAVIVKAPPGAGKSTLVRGVARALEADGLVPIATQTNAQADQLVLQLHAENPTLRVARLFAGDTPADQIADAAAISRGMLLAASKYGDLVDDGARIIVAPAAKWAHIQTGEPFPWLIVDECFQMRADMLQRIAPKARRMLLIGDPGQLSPFTVLDTDRWQALPHSPIRPAMDVLTTNRPGLPEYAMRVSWRLPPSAAGLVADCFYPDVSFIAGSTPAARTLTFTRPRIGATVADDALEQAAATGWTYLELPGRHTARADSQTAQTIVDLVITALNRQGTVVSELGHERDGRLLTAADLAVVTTHTAQANLVVTGLEDAGVDTSALTITTANKIQGREFALTIAWHPLAGRVDATEFHLDPGRMCVMLSRHRHACVVVGRAGTADILLEHPDNTDLIIGEPEPQVDGVTAHHQVLERLGAHRTPVAV
jgi:hypothetical protein